MFLLLAGLLLVSIAAVISAVPHNSNAECVSIAWLVNVGYTLELVPLIIKVYAVNHLIQAAKEFRRVKLKRESLFGAVLLLTVATMIFMIIWTLVDPPRVIPDYLLTDETNDAGETVVSVCSYCRSDSNVWGFISLAMQGFLLFVASVMAFQMRNLQHELNESQSLAILIYSHSIFWVLRLVVFAWLENTDFASVASGIHSLLLGVDSIASICIYFIPKFFKEDTRRQATFLESAAVSALETSGVTKSMAVRFQDTNSTVPSGDLGTVSAQTSGYPSEASGGASDGMHHRKSSARLSDSLHGVDAVQYEGECPHCGREIVQDLLLSELEPLKKSDPCSHDEELAIETGTT
jgi:hypothetical protein